MYGLQVVCIDCGEPVEAGKNRCAKHLRRTPDRAVVDDDDTRCSHKKKALDERLAVYAAALVSGKQTERKRKEVVSAVDDYAHCLEHGWELEPQTPWQTWGEGWEKVYA